MASEAPVSRGRRVLIGLAVGLGVATAAAVPYAGILDAPFVFDDVKFVTQNHFLREAYENPGFILETFDIRDRRWDQEDLRPNYRPLRFLSYTLDYALTRWWFGEVPASGPRPFFFHLSNVILHALNALLVFVAARQILRPFVVEGAGTGATALPAPDFAALVAALLFALHPLQTEAVAYVSGRRDVLSTFFFLAALALHLRRGPGAGPGLGAVLGVPLLLAAALLAKEMAVTLPAVLLCSDLALGARWNARRAAVHVLAWAVTLASIAFTLGNETLIDAGTEEVPASGLLALLMAPRYVLRYLGLSLFPVRQSIDYSFDAIPGSTGILTPPATLPSALAVLAMVAGAAWLLFRRPPGAGEKGSGSQAARPAGALLAFSLLWFIGTLVPVLQLVPTAERFAERFAYLPFIGIAILAGAAAARVRRFEPLLGWGLAGGLCLAALLATVARCEDWKSPLALWTSAVEAQPRAARAHFGRATALKEAGRLREAAEEFTRAIEIFRERPATPLHHGYLLQALTLRGGVHGLLAREEPELLERAVQDYREVLAARDVGGAPIAGSPEYTAVHFDLAGFCLQAKKLDEARAEYQRVLDIGKPETLVAAAEYYLGKIALLEGDVKAAAARMRSGWERIPPGDPSRGPVAIEVADLLIDLKELDAAQELISRGLSGAGGRERLHLLYREAKALDRRGDLPGSIAVLSGILAEDPGYAPAEITLARTEAMQGKLEAAEERYRRVLGRDPANAEALQGLKDLVLRKSALERQGKEPGAETATEEPGGEQVLTKIAEKGNQHFAKGEFFAARDAAVELLKRARTARRKDFELRAVRDLGRVAERIGRPKEAEAYYGEALALAAGDPETLRLLGDLQLRRFNDRERARWHYERYLEALPAGEKADPLVHHNLAQLLAKSDPSRAIEHCLRAREAGYAPPALERTLGYLYAEVGSWKRSLEAFTRYLEANPGGEAAPGALDLEREAVRAFVAEKVLPRVNTFDPPGRKGPD